MNNTRGRRLLGIILFTVIICSLSAVGCKWIQMNPNLDDPKQGDVVSIQITVGQPSNIANVRYKVNDITGTTTSLPYIVTINTCKAPGKYLTQLSLWGEATYNDGTIKSFNRVYDLTVANVNRHNAEFTYVFYLSNSDDDWMDCGTSGANAFIDEFDSRSDYKYFWSAPFCFSSPCNDCASNFDLVIAWGHGVHHTFYSASSPVDISATAYGGCAFCNYTGDTKYLAFASCDILSLDDNNAQSFWYYWFNNQSTRFDKRPFEGLHMVMGFRTLMVIDTWSFLWSSGDNADDFFGNFAGKLDDGWSVKDAWLYSVDDELSFDDGNNRGTVIYNKAYEYDAISSSTNDFIYGNSDYFRQAVEYWE